jgi:hypothetical protein
VPALPVEMTRRFSADGLSARVVRMASYFFNSPLLAPPVRWREPLRHRCSPRLF